MDQGDYFTVTVTVKMTKAQREAYAREYSMDGGVADDVARRLPEDIKGGMNQIYWIRSFASSSVSEAR